MYLWKWFDCIFFYWCYCCWAAHSLASLNSIWKYIYTSDNGMKSNKLYYYYFGVWALNIAFFLSLPLSVSHFRWIFLWFSSSELKRKKVTHSSPTLNTHRHTDTSSQMGWNVAKRKREKKLWIFLLVSLTLILPIIQSICSTMLLLPLFFFVAVVAVGLFLPPIFSIHKRKVNKCNKDFSKVYLLLSLLQKSRFFSFSP